MLLGACPDSEFSKIIPSPYIRSVMSKRRPTAFFRNVGYSLQKYREKTESGLLWPFFMFQNSLFWPFKRFSCFKNSVLWPCKLFSCLKTIHFDNFVKKRLFDWNASVFPTPIMYHSARHLCMVWKVHWIHICTNWFLCNTITLQILQLRMVLLGRCCVICSTPVSEAPVWTCCIEAISRPNLIQIQKKCQTSQTWKFFLQTNQSFC